MIEDALRKLVTDLLSLENLAAHWPFLAMLVTQAWIGFFMSKRVFTRERATLFRGKSWKAQLTHWAWYWGKETLPIHPIAVALPLTFIWPDPEGRGWNGPTTAGYWVFCGAMSMIAWLLLKGWAKRKGITLYLPGDSTRPPQR